MRFARAGAVAAGLALAALAAGCTDDRQYARAVYMLVDTSGTYTAELRKADQIISYLDRIEGIIELQS